MQNQAISVFLFPARLQSLIPSRPKTRHPLKIAYYMPFKPLGHPNPSGDLVTGTEIHEHLNLHGFDCRSVSSLRSRWIYYRPLSWLQLFREQYRISAENNLFKPDLWFTYHSYYKAPDLLGPRCASQLNIPYIIFQGIYSTKRRKKIKTMAGFYLNKWSLLKSDLIFTNKKRDEKNLLRILPANRICYLAPGIHTRHFNFCAQSRKEQREKWGIGNDTVILTAAMFRPGVKTKGILKVIHSCGELAKDGDRIRLVIAGDGHCRKEIKDTAEKILPGRVTFCGKIPREEMFRLYSAADIFAFPGIEESLGMVYLEAQCCGLPVIAYEDWGGSEAVEHDHTGLLSSAEKPNHFTHNIHTLITNKSLRLQMGKHAAQHIRDHHELHRGYGLLREKLGEIHRVYTGQKKLMRSNF